MSQTVTGLRGILSHPFFYDFFQNLLGASRARARWTRDFIRPFPGMRILDIGCGTAELLGHLPEDAEYTGFDMSEAYIAAARKRYGKRKRVTLVCADVEAVWKGTEMPAGYDVVTAIGVLHHLDDEEARSLFRSAYRALKPGGRLITIDPAFVPDQSPFARMMVSRDRGRNVRFPEAYAGLGKESFSSMDVTVSGKALRIPYDHAVLVCRR